MTIEIILDGATKAISQEELFDLARRGVINSNTNLLADGKLITADKVEGIVFCSEEELELTDEPNPFVKKVSPAATKLNPATTSVNTTGNNDKGVLSGIGFLLVVLILVICYFSLSAQRERKLDWQERQIQRTLDLQRENLYRQLRR